MKILCRNQQDFHNSDNILMKLECNNIFFFEPRESHRYQVYTGLMHFFAKKI